MGRMTTPEDPNRDDIRRTDPTDPLPREQFSSWHSALKQNLLKSAQVETLQNMIDDGRAKSMDEAAAILDLQETIIHPAEHMWGS
jgi:hypothetical protein